MVDKPLLTVVLSVIDALMLDMKSIISPIVDLGRLLCIPEGQVQSNQLAMSCFVRHLTSG